MAFRIRLKERVEKIVLEVMNKYAVNFINAAAFPDGKVNATAADGKHADLLINAATTATDSVPVAPHVVGTLAVGDEVVVLRRSARDMMVIAKKQK